MMRKPIADSKGYAKGDVEESDPVWDLLSRDARSHDVSPSPWFATRVSAMALATPQDGRRSPVSLLRWLIPIPLACSALLAVAAWNHSRISEEKFERHMEFLASSSYDYEV
jgi:hypothetical protein